MKKNSTQIVKKNTTQIVKKNTTQIVKKNTTQIVKNIQIMMNIQMFTYLTEVVAERKKISCHH